jgi:predicted RNase H-like HicB family nuclease
MNKINIWLIKFASFGYRGVVEEIPDVTTTGSSFHEIKTRILKAVGTYCEEKGLSAQLECVFHYQVQTKGSFAGTQNDSLPFTFFYE